MPSIKDSIKTISTEIKELRSSATEAAKATKDIGANLKFDPSNVNLIVQRFSSLKKELEENKKLLDGYNKDIAKLKSLRDKLDPNAKEHAEEWNVLTKTIENYSRAASRTESTINSLNAATSQNAQVQAVAKAATDNTKKSFEKLEKAAKTLSIAVIALVGVVTKMTTSAMEQGKELYSLSRRYSIAAEELQKWNKTLELATGESDLFTNSLQVMSKGLSTIPVGRGVAYNNALLGIGVAFKEIQNLSPEQQFSTILDGLAAIEDASIRSAYATQLFGDNGQYVASIFEDSTKSLEEYKAEANEYAYITSETSKKLADMSFELEKANSQFSVAYAELAVSLSPAISTFAGLVKDYVAPAIKDAAERFDSLGEGGQKVFLALILIIVVLPKIVSGIGLVTTAINTAKTASIGLSLATMNWQVILLAVASVIMLIIGLVAIFSDRAKKAQEQVDKMQEAAEKMKENAGEFSSDTTQNYSSSSQKNISVDMDVYAHGDSPISQETAETISQLTIDGIQKQLGDLIK